MLPLISRFCDRLARRPLPLWGHPFVWTGLAILLIVGSVALVPRDGRGQGVHFTYTIFADGRRVPGWVSNDTTGATAELYFAANIWSTDVLGFRRWRCDVSVGDRMRGPMPPAGMTQADVDTLLREGCAHVIEASRGDHWGQFVFPGVEERVPLREDIPGVELMSQGGGFGCGHGLEARVGEAMHRMYRWVNRAGLACGVVAVMFSMLHHFLRGRVQRRMDLIEMSLCPGCEYPLLDRAVTRCSECKADVVQELRRCQLVLTGPLAHGPSGPNAPAV